MSLDLVQQERKRRQDMWERLRAAGGPTGVAPAVLRNFGIYGGAQGIWVDKARTAALTPDGAGVTVGLLHTGSSYADDLADDGVMYHYPSTQRPAGRDAAEVAATKSTRALHLPLFVITYPSPGASTRDVRLGWVEDWDDEGRIFLIAFGEQEPHRPIPVATDEDFFVLTEGRRDARREVDVRLGQPRFKFRVLKRYGPQCAVCGLAVLEVLDAAHICPRNAGGSDDPRNGLVLCAVHHRAFDARLFAVEPESLAIRYRPGGPDVGSLRIRHGNLAHLPRLPHRKALEWHWHRWSQHHLRSGGDAVE